MTLTVRACSFESSIRKLHDVIYNPEHYEGNPDRHVDLKHGPTNVVTGLRFQVSLTLLACINITITS